MEVILKEKKYVYTSDYPDGWQFSSGDFFKTSVLIGNYTCFIKRFEYVKPQDISGWEFLNKLKGKFEPCLPKIYDIVTVEENRKQVHYVFYENLKGSTLNVRYLNGKALNLEQLMKDMFSAVESIRKYGYWFADFCEKNIFCEDNGRFRLLDLDSVQPLARVPNNDMYGNKDYWAMVFNFYRQVIAYKDIRLGDIPGISLNYLQIIFLILNLRIFSQDQQLEYMSHDVFDNLPVCLHNIDPRFKELFIHIFENANLEQDANIINEIQHLVSGTIIHQAITYPPLPLRHDEPAEIESEDNLTGILPLDDGEPATFYREENEEQLLEVEAEAKAIEPSNDQSDITGEVSEEISRYDDDMNDHVVEQASYPVEDITEVKKTDEEKNVLTNGSKDDEPPRLPNRPARKIRYAVLGGLLAAIIVAAIFYVQPKKANAEITRIVPLKVVEGSSLILTGKNFPKQPAEMKVLFNNVPGTIFFNSDSFLRVGVPVLGSGLGNGNVQVMLVVKNDTTVAREKLLVEKEGPQR